MVVGWAAMEAVNEIHATANSAFSSAFNALDRHVRPVTTAYFKCCVECSEPSRAPEAMTDCMAQCQAPLRRVQEALAERQEAFQNKVRACHGAAGKAVSSAAGSGGGDDNKPPTPAQLALYTDALRPCVEREVGAIGASLDGVRSLGPAALADIKTATPKRAGGWLW